MSNNYYEFVPPLVVGSKARAGEVNNQFAAIEAAFDLLPTGTSSLVFGTNTLATESGSGNTYVVTTADNPRGTLVEGEEVVFKATHQNTGASTLNRDGIGAVTLRRFNGDALDAADIVTGRYYAARYDAAQMQWRVLWPAQVTTVSGALTYAAPSNDVGLSAPTEGVATTVLRSDATFRLSQAITPTWTGTHTFSNTVNFDGAVDFDSTVAIDGVATFSNTVNFDAAVDFDAAAVFDGTVDINGALTIDGVSTFSTTVNFDGAVDFDAAAVFDGTVDINGTLTIDGVSTFSTTVNFDGAVDFDGTTNFDAAATFNNTVLLTSSLEVDGAANFDGAADFDSTANFDGAASFTNSFTSGNAGAVTITANAPLLELDQANAATNDRRWWFRVSSEQFQAQLANDARTSSTSWLAVDRTDNTVDSIALSSTALTWNGVAMVNLNSTPTWTEKHTFTNNFTGTGDATIELNANTPGLEFFDANGAANNRRFSIYVGTEQLVFDIATDAGVAANWLTVDRTGGAVDRVHFPNQTTKSFVVGTVGAINFGETGHIRTTAGSGCALACINIESSSSTLVVHNEATLGNNVFVSWVTDGNNTRGSVDFNRAGVAVRYNTTSDRALKENILGADSALDMLLEIPVRKFRWKESKYEVKHGFIAQEVYELYPDAVSPGGQDKPWSMDYSKLVPMMFKAIQELTDEVRALKIKSKEKLN